MVVINNLYRLHMEIEDYDLGILGGEDDDYPTETKIRIYARDFNNKQKRDFGYGVDVTVNCNKGYFDYATGYMDETTDYGENSLDNVQTFTSKIGIGGYIELDYIPSEWGFCTITCDNIIKNVFVRGFKKVQNDPPLYVDESIRACRLIFTNPSVEMTGSQKTLLTNAVPQKYLPNSYCYFNGYRDDLGFSLTTDGDIRGRRGTGSNFTPSSTQHLFEWRY